MVNPDVVYADALRLQRPPGPDQQGNVTAPQLFTLALLRAGRDGCKCPSCRYLAQLEDLMADEVERPFQQPAPAATAAPPPAPPPAPAPPPTTAPAGPAPEATPPPVSQEPAGA